MISRIMSAIDDEEEPGCASRVLEICERISWCLERSLMISSSSSVKGSSPGGTGCLLVKLELRGGEDMVGLLFVWVGYEVSGDASLVVLPAAWSSRLI
jgi:hypothetical protein